MKTNQFILLNKPQSKRHPLTLMDKMANVGKGTDSFQPCIISPGDEMVQDTLCMPRVQRDSG